MPADENTTFRRVIQTGNELYEACFGRTGAADDADGLPGRNMQIDVFQRHAIRLCGVFEADVFKIHAAVRHIIDGGVRVMEVAFLVEHLADTLCRSRRHGNHDEDHREHHQPHQNLHGVGDHARQRADIQIRAAGLDNELCREVADQDAADRDAELHERIVEREDFLCAQEITAHIVRLGSELFGLIVFAHEALDHAHCLHVFLHGVVEPVVLLEDCLEKRHCRLCHQIQTEAEDRNDAGEDEGKLLADLNGHHRRKNQHHRRADRHTDHHHERLLHVRHVGRQARHERRRGEAVDIRERKILHLIV